MKNYSIPTCALLELRVRNAIVEAFGADYLVGLPALAVPAAKMENGDYQSNAAMPLAKPLKMKPVEVAQKIVEKLKLEDVADTPTVAGPGFINIALSKKYVQDSLRNVFNDPERLSVPPKSPPMRIVVDFSSPNIAKEMHVGHLRSTIIGDSISRTLEFLGHDVLRLNHVGDWGTQFGMLIMYLKEVAPEALADESTKQLDLGDLVVFYKKAKKRFDEDEAFQEAARLEVVKLQAGNADSIKAWKMLCQQSRVEFQKIYDMLKIDLIERGESFYNPYLNQVIQDLDDAGILTDVDGAKGVILEGMKNKDQNGTPLLVQKKDGGFMYATTDLAAIKYRSETDKAQRILYLTDAGQANHFEQVFYVAKKGNLYPADTVSLEHVPFGLVQGEDGKKFKTRSGDTVRLIDLLNEGIEYAKADFITRLKNEGRDEPEEYINEISTIVAMAAVKYADLKCSRISNYRFSFSKMLSLQGNTAPYMLYAYARVQGIYRKGEVDITQYMGSLNFHLDHPAEFDLARYILKFPEFLDLIERDLKPSYLCDYIYELASKFNQFYESCSVLNAHSEEVKLSRLALCETTARTLRFAMKLLGIDVLNKL